MLAVLILDKIVKLFSIMVIGYIMVKIRFVKSADSDVLSKIALFLLAPLCIINSFNFEASAQVLRGIGTAFFATALLLAVFCTLDLLCIRRVFSNEVERTSVMYSNAGNLLIPLVMSVLGPEWVVYSTAYMSVQMVFFWTHCIHIFQPESKVEIKKILCNANIIAIAVGVFLMLTGLRLPALVADVFADLGNMLGPICMLVTGMLAAEVDFKQAVKNIRVYRVIFLRMVVYPLISLVVVKLVALLPFVAKDVLFIPFLASITPPAVTVTQFAQLNNKNPELAVEINIFSMIVCVATLPLLVRLYEMF